MNPMLMQLLLGGGSALVGFLVPKVVAALRQPPAAPPQYYQHPAPVVEAQPAYVAPPPPPQSPEGILLQMQTIFAKVKSEEKFKIPAIAAIAGTAAPILSLLLPGFGEAVGEFCAGFANGARE